MLKTLLMFLALAFATPAYATPTPETPESEMQTDTPQTDQPECLTCGQPSDVVVTGEYPCKACGQPTVHDAQAETAEVFHDIDPRIGALLARFTLTPVDDVSATDASRAIEDYARLRARETLAEMRRIQASRDTFEPGLHAAIVDAQAGGQVGYQAYAQSTGGKTFDGRDMPTWEQLPERIQQAWIAATQAAHAALS